MSEKIIRIAEMSGLMDSNRGGRCGGETRPNKSLTHENFVFSPSLRTSLSGISQAEPMKPNTQG